jgi:hypothetical protein
MRLSPELFDCRDQFRQPVPLRIDDFGARVPGLWKAGRYEKCSIEVIDIEALVIGFSLHNPTDCIWPTKAKCRTGGKNSE